MFVNRRTELSELNTYLDMILAGNKVNVSLFGQRRTGKTELLRRFKEEVESLVLVPYLSLERSLPNMENFSLHFIGELIRAATGDHTITMEWSRLILAARDLGTGSMNTIVSLMEHFQKKDYQVDIIGEILFRIPETISADSGKSVIIMIDEFQEIKNIDDRILDVMRANTEKQRSVNYWVAGSVFSAFEEIFEGDKPFFGQFRRLDLARFNRSSTYELVDGFMPFTIPAEMKNMIFRVTGGHPFYITSVCTRFRLMVDMTDRMDMDILKTAILMEVFDKTGNINGHFEYILDISLSKFRNRKVHQNILYHLCKNSDNLTGISEAIGKPSGEVSSYMKGLLKTDLISRKGDIYSLTEPLMATWLLNRFERDDSFLDLKLREKTIQDLLESYSSVSTELGKSKEVELRGILSKKLGMDLKPYSTPDGQIEFDLVGTDSGFHIFEIKWRNRPVDLRTMERFHSKVDGRDLSTEDPILYIISKGGFDSSAIRFAVDRKIRCMNSELEEIDLSKYDTKR